MKLVHKPIVQLKTMEMPVDDYRALVKPRGLWVSDDDSDYNWRTWCVSDGFGLERLMYVHDVELVPNANVLVLKSAEDIDSFTREWADTSGEPWKAYFAIPWPTVQKRYSGMVITPYIWERRLDFSVAWYYGWDCASGCIWDLDAIASITLRR